MSYTGVSIERCNEIRHPNLLFDNIIWDPRSAETGSHAERRNLMHTTFCTDRRGYAQWPFFVGLDMSEEEMRTTSPAE